MNIKEYAEILKALGHPVRLKIVCGLMKKDNCSVSIMAEKLNISQPVVSQHLNVLKNAGIIAGYRKMNRVCYRLENDKVRRIIRILGEELCVQL